MTITKRTAVAVPVAAVYLGSWVVSAIHIYSMARQHGQSQAASALYPVIIDMLMIGGAVIFMSGERKSWLGWTGVFPGITGTLFANYESAAGQGQVAHVVASIPAAALTVSTLMLELWFRNAPETPEAGPEAPEASVSVPTVRQLMNAHRIGFPKAKEMQEQIRAGNAGINGYSAASGGQGRGQW